MSNGRTDTNREMQSYSDRLPSGERYRLTLDTRLKIQVMNKYGQPIINKDYVIMRGDHEITGITDDEGWIKHPDVRASDVTVRLADGSMLYIPENQEDINYASQSPEAEEESEAEEVSPLETGDKVQGINDDPDVWQQDVFEKRIVSLGFDDEDESQ
ncbi:MAG: hypothetical protein V1720_17715 [bacterium]